MGKITIIFSDENEVYRPVEVDGDSFILLNGECEHPIYIVRKDSKGSTDESSTLYFNAEAVLAIGFSEQMEPIVNCFVLGKRNEDPDKYIL